MRRIVVKIGTSILTTSTNRLDTSYLEELTDEIAALRRDNRQIALVTSGAIAAGMKSLGLAERPKKLSEVQATAAVGQSNLMRTYERLFKERGLVVGQVLLTRDITKLRYSNARGTLNSLFDLNVIPIVNENDAIAAEEIRFGDNDTLSAVVAELVDADLLVMLSDVDGFKIKGGVCSEICGIIGAHIVKEAQGSGSVNSVGGMITKLGAAKRMLKNGKITIIANGRTERILQRILDGEKLGTIFFPAFARHSGLRRAKPNARLTKRRAKE